MTIGTFIGEHRRSIGISQGDLANLLCELTGHPTLTREDVSRWERGKRTPGRFWLPHLATALEVPLAVLEAERVKRRTFITAASLAPLAESSIRNTADGIMSAIAAGDAGPLAKIQTSHHTDLLISAYVAQDRPSAFRLARWMENEPSDILRVNAAGILAKVSDHTLADSVAKSLAHDDGLRHRYLTAFEERVGTQIKALTSEITNPRDSGARWCAGYLLSKDGSPQARAALAAALHTEPVRENVRAYAIALNGADPCR